MKLIPCALLVVLIAHGCEGWDQEELDLFDLVEEVEENFYEIMGVEQSASASEIRKAFRHLSLKLHPDKSDDPDASEKFRKLVAVAEVLKDEQKREWYDRILVEGLPDWKQPLFYYRRVRKMGLVEMSVAVLIIATVAHFLWGWAVYVEKQLVLQELFARKQKKERKTKKSTKGVSLQLEAELEFHTAQAKASIPSLRTLLPVVVVKNCIFLAKLVHQKYRQWQEQQALRREEEKRLHETEEDHHKEQDEKEGSEDDKTSEKQVRRRSGRRSHQNGGTQQTQTSNRAKNDNNMVANEVYESGSYEDQLEAVMNDLDDDEYDIKTKKGSKGSQQHTGNHGNETATNEMTGAIEQKRIERLPDNTNGGDKTDENVDNSSNKNMSKTAQEHTGAKKAQESLSRPDNAEGHNRVPLSDVSPSLNEGWSQYQQTQLEWALAQYPKFSKDRWENIARAVPGKTTEDCVSRCKELFEAVRKRRADNVS